MAIDLIENNELGALSQSRLGSKCFVDDNRYANLSIVSKKEKERRTARSKAEVDASWSIDPVYENNCEYLTTRLRELQDSIENEMSKNPSQTTKQRLVFPMKDYETRYKQLITRNKCVEITEKQEAEASKKETLDILTRATSTPPELLEASKSDKTTKYIIYGVGGVIVLISLVLLLRKSN